MPGGFGRDVTKGGGKATAGDTTQGLPKVRAMPGMDAFFDPEPRYALMKDMGIDRTLLWPTLASVLEGRVADDPDIAVAVIHALNEWMHEHWSYVYSDAIYATPIISLAAGSDRAIEELEYINERGAKIFLMRIAPVPTWKGRKSFALPEFDPFWARVQELGLVVGMHSGDGDDPRRYQNDWDGMNADPLPFKAQGSPAFARLSVDKSLVQDGVASIIGHGLASRFPELKFMPVEFAATWVRPFVQRLQDAYEASPMLFDEDPFEVFKRNIYVHIFHEPDPEGLLDLGHSRRPPHVRLRLPSPGGDGRSARLFRSGVGPSGGDTSASHGRRARKGNEGRQVRILRSGAGPEGLGRGGATSGAVQNLPLPPPGRRHNGPLCCSM